LYKDLYITDSTQVQRAFDIVQTLSTKTTSELLQPRMHLLW